MTLARAQHALTPRMSRRSRARAPVSPWPLRPHGPVATRDGARDCDARTAARLGARSAHAECREPPCAKHSRSEQADHYGTEQLSNRFHKVEATLGSPPRTARTPLAPGTRELRSRPSAGWRPRGDGG